MNRRESGLTAASLRRDFDEAFAAAPAAKVGAIEDFLAIRVGGDPYAIRLSLVTGLHRDRRITPSVSEMPELLGLAGFRGTVAPIYRLDVLLGYPSAAGPRWLVLTGAPTPVGLAFDAFDGHARVSRESVVTPGADETGGSARSHIRGVLHADAAGLTRPVVDVASVLTALARRIQSPRVSP